jgi:uncharacterized protein (UPF0332 family)
MRWTEEEKGVVVGHRMGRARETWVEARDLADLGHWHGAANRLYYACYYAVTALLMEHGYVAHTHGGVLGLFGKHFVATGVVSRERNKLYRKLFDLRQGGDYSDWMEIEEGDVRPLLGEAWGFIEGIGGMIGGS